MNGVDSHRRRSPAPGDEVVISGLSGRFPESDDVKMLEKNLMGKVDLITDDERRWRSGNPEVPHRIGKIRDVEKFDALFFGVHNKQANVMDPQIRLLLEHTYEAILDAGINPRQIRGKNVGVYIGTHISETEEIWLYDRVDTNGLNFLGCARTMFANRISYFLDVTGPSFAVDTACSSTLTAMENAYRAINDGCCDAAIVGGSHLCLIPYTSLQYNRLGVLSPDGRCKTFDESADGFARGEAISVAFLQKAKDAKRIYATLVHAKTNCDGFKPESITFPSTRMQGTLLREFYKECGIPPTIVEYVEAHGTGTRVGDPEEVNAIDTIFCAGRKEPLKIGSSKSNYGHSEPVSGLSGVTKVIIAMESGLIPPNINYKTPKPNIKAIVDGRINVVTEPTPWKGGYAGVNAFGFGGANAHVLLKSNHKEKVNNGAPRDDLPRLVVASGRTEEAVWMIINDLNSKPIDVEYVGLLHNIHSDDIAGNLYRGFTILPAHGMTETPIIDVKPFPETKRPVWFVFSGMGSQWAGMGEALLRLPIFYAAVKKCDAVLKPHGIEIFNLLTNRDPTIYDNILNCFVGIAAVQIGLVDVLRSVGIEPDNIIGHSVGELGCAYADGCFTAEQMILAAYARGRASLEANLIKGSMAAVGLGYNDLKKLCPPDIEVACHNSYENATISGPAESMDAFVADLKAKKIFARQVPTGNIAYHSRYVAPAGPKLLASLKKIIPDPKPRSSKWLSSSIPKSEWESPLAQLSSAEYHTNNLLKPVLFEETSTMIPKDAITIEIAPHGLLQAILRRSLGPQVTNIPMTQRNHEDNLIAVLQSLGKMFIVGMHPQVANLYPAVQFPVSRGTQMISPLIRWDHTDDWFVVSDDAHRKTESCERFVTIDTTDIAFEYVTGHVIDGRNLFPATGYLFLVWDTLSSMHGKHYNETSVVFEDVTFLRATNIPKDKPITLTIVVPRGSGRFEISEADAAVVTGRIRVCNNPSAERITSQNQANSEDECMGTRDVYKELKLRGYQYTGIFRSIVSSTADGSKGHISWQNNWSAFMDNIMQMKILGVDSRELFVPTRIAKLIIDPISQYEYLEEAEDNALMVYVDNHVDVVSSGGVEIHGLRATSILRRKPAGEPVLEEYKFIPYRDQARMGLRDVSRLVAHVVVENHLDFKVKILEFTEGLAEVSLDNLMTPFVAESLADIPLIQTEAYIINTNLEFDSENLPPNVSIIEAKKVGESTEAILAFGNKLLTGNCEKILNLMNLGLKRGGFLVSRETVGTKENIESLAEKQGLEVILEKICGSECFVLLRKKTERPEKILIIDVNSDDLNWLEKMQTTMSEELNQKSPNMNKRILFVGQGRFENGLLGLVNCLRREMGGEIIRGLLIQDNEAPKFSLQNPFYAKQLQKDLIFNVLRKNSVWGSYRHIQLTPIEPEPVNHAWINQSTRGDLSSLKWFEGPLNPAIDREHLVHIYYSSINFKDVMLATGKLTSGLDKNRKEQECVIGLEYSGIHVSGKRVMGLLENRCLSSLCISDPDLLWELPNEWSLEDAATIPAAYATCYYALYFYGKMKKKDKILIHVGSGAVGQAAINLALHEGCEIFTTVGTQEKRRFIREHFPQIPESHIGNSRDTSFRQMIMKETNGRGVDIVLNSLAEEKLQASVKCLAPRGRFLEIGKYDLVSNTPLGMEVFLQEIRFQGIMLDKVIVGERGPKIELDKLMKNGLKAGAIKPLVRTVFERDQVELAFRHMAAGKHIGKVMIKVREANEPINSKVMALPQFYCLKGRSYIILGGLGGFGLELADWLVLRGAQNLILTSRTGFKTGYQKLRVKLWESYGVRVVIVVGKDASVAKDCQSILETATKLAPVDGIFNLAVVLKDATWENQTRENFEESFRSKALATKQLDILTRKHCPLLRHFVVFSSVSCGRGNAGQTNYGMSNSVMERICESRVSEGLPGLAIQWGAVGDVGLVADMQEDHKELVIGGTLQQTISSCLHELDEFLQRKLAVVSSMVVAEKKFGSTITTNIVEAVLSIMGLKDLRGVSSITPLSELGMDSMMGVEIKQTFERDFEIFLTSQDIRVLTFAKLEEMRVQLDDGKGQTEIQIAADDDKVLEGMKMLVRLVNSDDINSKVSLRLPSIDDKGRDEIFLIPGIEGLGSVFSTLTPKIRSPVICLQLGTQIQDSVDDMAQALLPYVLKESPNPRNVTVIGYSYGAVIATELVRKLEAEGRKCQFILIDGAPGPLESFINQKYSSKNVEELQKELIMTIADNIYPDNLPELSKNLERCSTWEKKLEVLAKHLPNDELNVKIEDLKSLSTAIYHRLLAIQSYDISKLPKIKTSITLLKPTVPSFPSADEDYGLSRITSGSVKVHHIEGNHITILDNKKVIEAINENSF